MVIWAPRALADLRDAWDHIAADNEAAADRVTERIDDAAERLGRHPLIGHPGRQTGSREFTVSGTRYFIVYHIRGDAIEITRVIHSARDWPVKG